MKNSKQQVETDANDVCPISSNKINKNVARLNAFSTLLALILFIFTPLKFIIMLLLIDFFVRAYIDPKCSPVSTISRNILNMLKIKSEMINAGPKIFAAKIGFILCLVTAMLYFYNFFSLSYSIAGVMIIFSSMEAFFGYCIGCHAYSLKQKIYSR